MSGTGAAPNDPEVMRAWLNGEPAYATLKEGKVVIENAQANVAGPGVILTEGVMTVDPIWLSAWLNDPKYTGAAPVPSAATTYTIGVGTPLVTAEPATGTWPPAGTVVGYVDPNAVTADAAPSKPKSRGPCLCYVVATAQDARALRLKLGENNPDVYIMYPGCAVIGRRFSTILITREANDLKSVGTPTEIERVNRWFLEALETRLTVDGVMVRL